MKKTNILLPRAIAASLAAMLLSASAASAADPLMRASKEIIYEPNGSQWVFTDSIMFAYNAMGLPVRELRSDSTVITTEYDAAGRMVSETSETLNPDGSLTRFKLRTRTYDELTGAITESREVNYSGSTETEGNCSRRTIVRNADGNIESVEIAVPYHGVYDPIQRLNISYGTDGKATELRWQQLVTGTSADDFLWADGESYTDIVWENTDGQIVNTDDLFRGNNRIRSAHYVNSNGSQPYYDYTIEVDYQEGNPGFRSVFRGLYQGLENSGVIRKYAETDNDDGSSEQRLDTSYFTFGENGEQLDPENYIDRARTDTHGNQILVEQIYWERQPATNRIVQEIIERTQTAYTYNAESGLIERTIVTEYDPDQGRQMPMIRVDSFDYVDCSQLNSISAPRIAAPEAGATEFFDLSGRRVAHPAGGIFIRRAGSKAELIKL